MTPTNSSWQPLASLARRLSGGETGRRGVVLLYHRVADLRRDPQRLAVSPERFSRQLEVLVEHGTPLTLEDMLRGAVAGTLPPRAVAVTFDDGYADNLDTAAPLLVRYGVPATVFVATSTLGASREFWWDELERLLLSPGRLPDPLSLSLGAEAVDYRLGADAVYSEQQWSRDAAWTVDGRSLPSTRHRVYVDLCARLRRVPPASRELAIGQLAALAGVSLTARNSHRPLSAGEVCDLAKLPGVTIGSHTVSHPSLAAFDREEQQSEIVRGRTRLEELTGTSVTAFAYPFGGRADVSATTIEVARQSGVTLACTTRPGPVRTGTSAFEVPRQIVRDWSAVEFLRQWQSWAAA